jgi:hypothetical protein
MRKTIGKQFQALNAQDSILSYVSTFSNNDRIYLYFGTPSSVTRAEVAPTTMQIMQETVIDCVRQYRTVDPPRSVNFNSNPVYTVSMWLNVQNQAPMWRQIFFFGQSDDWTWRGNVLLPTVDRAPALWIYPSQHNSSSKVWLHFRHRVNSNGNDFWSFNYGLDVTGDKNTVPLRTWFHYAVTVNKNVMKAYINGSLVGTVDYGASGYTFQWNPNDKKKFYIGYNPTWPNKSQEIRHGTIHLQKLYWWNSELDPSTIRALSQESIVSPTAITGVAAAIPPPQITLSKLKDLFGNVTESGVNYLKIGNTSYPVYIDITNYNGERKQWLLVLNYLHKANTSPELFPRKLKDGPPLSGNNTLGTDGSLDQSTYGHATPELLKAINDQCGGFGSMRFYARGGNCKYGWDQWSPQCNDRIIHFTTTDKKWLDYAMTGKGSVCAFTYTLLPEHNATIPQNFDGCFRDQGDYALTEFPFYRNAAAHWVIGGGKGWLGLRYRYEVDDWGRNMYNTLHQVWIGL